MCLSIAIHFPDRVLNRGVHAGHEWIVTHNGMGSRCGYVKVEPGHPWHGKDEDDIAAEVHGGLTFAEADTPCGKGEDAGYWVGFDCAHSGDLPDPSLPNRWPSGFGWNFPDSAIRTQGYVESECRSLCEQAAHAGGTGSMGA